MSHSKSARVGGVTLPVPIIVAAGVAKHPTVAQQWAQVAPTIAGSFSINQRSGNPGPKRIYPTTLQEFEALGYMYNRDELTNIGAPAMVRMLTGVSTPYPLGLSLVAFTADEMIALITTVAHLNIASVLELDISCRNTEQEPIALSESALRDLLRRLPTLLVPIWIKLPPFTGKDAKWQRQRVAHLCNHFLGTVQAVVTCNSKRIPVPQDKISSSDGYASMSGPAIAPESIEELVILRDLLHPTIDIVNVGGISLTGRSIVGRLELGAAAVQLASALYYRQPGDMWPQLLEDGYLEPYLRNQGYLTD